ncbi:hypothetical protein [Bacillus testis]|uniref:hypothetical protein n=1 Tax=Bacillus testis TaxID=1622072 RepID=UPI00067F7310|nr:hypothetical protein [Bacillus testis]
MDKNFPSADLLEKLKTARILTEKMELPQSIKEQLKLTEKLPTMVHTPLTNENKVGEELQRSMEEWHKNEQEEKQREEEYKESVLNALLGIEKNTALLTEMTLLLQTNNDKQDEIFAIMVEILEIMKSANEEEANSKFTKVMKKITTFTENASTMQSLLGMANAAFNAYQGLPF